MHKSKVTLSKEKGILLEFGTEASIKIDNEGTITLKGKKLVMDFSQSVEAKGGTAEMKMSGSVKIDGKPTEINGQSFGVKS